MEITGIQYLVTFDKSVIIEHEWPLRLILRKRSPLGTLLSVMLWTLSLPVLIYFLTLVENNFYFSGPDIGIIEDWNVLFIFVEIPIMLLILKKIFSRFSIFLHKIPEVINLDKFPFKRAEIDTRHNTLVTIMASRKKWRLFRMILFALGIMFVLFNGYSRAFLVETTWGVDRIWASSDYPITYWVTNIYTTLIWGYLLPIFAYKMFSIIFAIRTICNTLTKEELFELRPLSPDKAGGLRSLGDLALTMSYIMIPFLIHILAVCRRSQFRHENNLF